jgi:hypothetical protein
MSKRILFIAAFLALNVLVFVLVYDRFVSSPKPTGAENATAPSAVSAGEAPTHEDASNSDATDAHRVNASGDSSSAHADESAASAYDATLIVQVVASTGAKQPLDSIRIELTSRDLSRVIGSESADGANPPPSISDAKGQARLRVASGVEFDLVADSTREDVGSAELTVPALKPGERREIVIELPIGNDLRVCGVVLDADGGAPIAGATAEAYIVDAGAASSASDEAAPGRAREPKRARAYASATADAAGRFVLDVPSWRDSYVRVSAKQFSAALSETDDEHDTADKPLEFRLTRNAVLHAHVLDEMDEPIPGVQVAAHVDSYRLASEPKRIGAALVSAPDEAWHATTNGDGDCVLESLPTGVVLHAQLEIGGRVRGKPFDISALTPGETTVQWRVDLGCELAGVVLDDHDAPVAKLSVWIAPKASVREGGMERVYEASARGSWHGYSHEDASAWATTDENGRFLFRDVSAGPWCIGFERDPTASPRDLAREFVPDGQRLEIARGARHQDVTVHLKHGEYIRGKVLEASGAPPESFSVMTAPGAAMECPIFYNTNELGAGYRARIENGGVFELGPLPHGEYELTACSYPWPAQPRSVPVRAYAKTGDADVVLRLGKRAMISGRVIDASTREAVVASVEANARLMAESTYSGSFAFESVFTGPLDLIATARGGLIGVLHVANVESRQEVSDLEIAVSRGATLQLRYDGPKDQCSVNVLSGDVLIARMRLSKAQAKPLLVPSGAVVVHVSKKGSNATNEQTVDVQAGEDREVVVKDE